MIFGSTGLIGKSLLTQLMTQVNSKFNEVHVVLRKQTQGISNLLEKSSCSPNIILHQESDFFKLHDLPHVDTVFYALGTTLKKAGSRKNFKKIELDLFTHLLSQMRTQKIIVVSAQGANSQSLLFYNKIKGKAEEILKEQRHISQKYIIRPSLLLGAREEKRVLEDIAKKIMPKFSFLIPKKLAPHHAKDVAELMIDLSSTQNNSHNDQSIEVECL